MFRSNETCAYYRQNSNGRKDNTGWKMCLMRFKSVKYLPNQLHHHPQRHIYTLCSPPVFFSRFRLITKSVYSVCGMVWLVSEGGADSR